jgi:hypothetical protein
MRREAGLLHLSSNGNEDRQEGKTLKCVEH